MITDGELRAYLERGARTAVTFSDDDSWVTAIPTMVKDGRSRQIELTDIDGAPVREHRLADALRAAGGRDTPRGIVFRG